jgi:hypothetical protein
MREALADYGLGLAFAGPITTARHGTYRNARSLAWPAARGGSTETALLLSNRLSIPAFEPPGCRALHPFVSKAGGLCGRVGCRGEKMKIIFIFLKTIFDEW